MTPSLVPALIVVLVVGLFLGPFYEALRSGLILAEPHATRNFHLLLLARSLFPDLLGKLENVDRWTVAPVSRSGASRDRRVRESSGRQTV
jgi:hypothetical protein